MSHKIEDLTVSEHIVKVPLSAITVKEDRYRQELGDIESLAESIKTVGQLVPVILTDDYTLIAGERRYRAHQLLKMDTIMAVIRTQSDIDQKIIEILENLERKEFTWKEQVLALDDLHQLFKASNKKWSERKTALKAGLSSGGVVTDLNLAEALKDDPDVFKGCKTKDSALKVLKKIEIDAAVAEVKMRKTKTNYGKKAQNVVFKGNCLDLIDQIPTGLVNAVISDPIYGLDINTTKKVIGFSELDIYEDDSDEYFKIMKVLIPKLARVMNDNSALVMFCRNRNFKWLYDEFTKCGIKCDALPAIWTRGTGQTNQPNIRMASSYEPFIYGFKGDATLIRPGLSNVLPFTGVHPNFKQHEVQKPLDLMEEIISRFCLPGHTILDPMCGSGTTLVAAIKKGCSPIGFELDEDNYNVSISRVADTLNAKDAGKLNLISDRE